MTISALDVRARFLLLAVTVAVAGCGDDGSEGGGSTSDDSTSSASQSSSGMPSGTTASPSTTSSTTEGSESSDGSTTVAGSSSTSGSGDTTMSDGSSSTGPEATPVATAPIVSASGSEATGVANFFEDGDQIRVEITVADAEPAGPHGVHIHETGDCSAPDGSSAGSHWNPGGSEHGAFEAGHLGDLGNIEIDRNGEGTLVLTTTMGQWAVGTGDDQDLLLRAIILHAGEDDLSPSPNPGPRIGCGEIVEP